VRVYWHGSGPKPRHTWNAAQRGPNSHLAACACEWIAARSTSTHGWEKNLHLERATGEHRSCARPHVWDVECSSSRRRVSPSTAFSSSCSFSLDPGGNSPPPSPPRRHLISLPLILIFFFLFLGFHGRGGGGGCCCSQDQWVEINDCCSQDQAASAALIQDQWVVYKENLLLNLGPKKTELCPLSPDQVPGSNLVYFPFFLLVTDGWCSRWWARGSVFLYSVCSVSSCAPEIGNSTLDVWSDIFFIIFRTIGSKAFKCHHSSR